MVIRELTIAGRRIADDTEPFVIAEIGHNHAGSIETAKRMFKIAAEIGVSAVKLQKRSLKDLYTKKLLGQSYDTEHSYARTYGGHREALEFGWAEYRELKTYADSLDLPFFATAFDTQSADFLVNLGVPAIKIASGDLTNTPLLEYCAGFDIPLIVSTGGHDIADVDRAVDLLASLGAQFALLQCTAVYPASHEDMNLRVVEAYRERYPDVVVGLSDHQDGISMAPVAWMLGARIFEKHFTLSRAAKGSDNAFSLEPEPMRKMVNDLHGVRVALGDGVKRRLPAEEPAMVKMGKSLYAKRNLPAGHILDECDIAIKSPGGGMLPYRMGELLGRQLSIAVDEDAPLSVDILARETACSYR